MQITHVQGFFQGNDLLKQQETGESDLLMLLLMKKEYLFWVTTYQSSQAQLIHPYGYFSSKTNHYFSSKTNHPFHHIKYP